MNSTEPSASSAPRPSEAPAPAGSAAKIDGRCRHRSPSGRRCIHPTKNPRSRLCPAHDAVKVQRHEGSRIDYLLGEHNDLLTAAEVNRSLAHLYFLLAEDQISPRRAAVLAYISNLMLRTFPAVEKEAAGDAPQLILDLPPRATGPASGTPPDPRDTDRPPHHNMANHNLANHNLGILAPAPGEKRDEPHDPYDGWRPPTD